MLSGSAIKAANFFSVGRRRTLDPIPRRGAAVLVKESDDDEDDESPDDEVKRNCKGKLEFHKTFVADSDDDADNEDNVHANDLMTDDEDDDVPLVQVGKEYLSDSKFEKINSWVQNSPFKERLSDYSSRVRRSPKSNDASHEDVESLLKSDPEDGDIVPSWAAPLPPTSGNKTSTTFQDEGSSKAMFSHKDDDESDVTKSLKASTARTDEGSSKAMMTKVSESEDQHQGSSKELLSSDSGSDQTVENERELLCDGGQFDNNTQPTNNSRESSLNNMVGSKILSSSKVISNETSGSMRRKNHKSRKGQLEILSDDDVRDSLNDTIDKLDELEINNVKKNKESEAIVISDDDDEGEIDQTKMNPKKREDHSTKNKKAPIIENSVNAVRCWTQEHTEELKRFKESASKPEKPARVDSSSDEEDFENFLTKLRSTRKPSVAERSESDQDFVVGDGEFCSDDFDDSDTPRSPVLSLRDRLQRKSKTDKSHQSPSSSSSSSDASLPSIPDTGNTPLTRKPGPSKRNVGSWRPSQDDDSDSSGSPRNIYQPKFYNQIPSPVAPRATPPPKPKRGTKTTTSKKPDTDSRPTPPGSSAKKQSCPVASFKTPTTLTFLSSLTMDTPVERCHPQALPYLKNFKKSKEELAKRLYQMYNDQIFNNALPDDMEITWNVRLTKTAGLCYSKRHRKFNIETRSSRIELSTKVIDRGDRLRDTLIHEMCHAASWIISGYRDGHGPLWRTWAEQAMRRFPELPVIDRCHSYQIQTKYTYRCVQCGYSIGRHSKSLDTERKVCGHCHGRFELVVNTGATPARGGASASNTATPASSAKPKAPTGFALFVKENYKLHKVPGKSHADVMKILSTKFSETKISK